MRKPGFCICENKDADQLRGSCEADQRLCFRYTDSTIPLLPKSEISCRGCTARFMSDQVGNPEDRFSHNDAQLSQEIKQSWPFQFGTIFCDPQLLYASVVVYYNLVTIYRILNP